MRKTLAALGILLVGIAIFPQVALAQQNFEIENPLNATTIPALVDDVINFIFLVALAVAPLMIIIAGFLFVTSAGKSEQISKAKRLITYALVGLAIVYGANILIDAIQRVLGM